MREFEGVIAKKKQTEVALQKSEAMFKGLFESSPDAIVVVNHEGYIVSVNKTLEMLFGYNRDELLHNTIEVLIPEHFKKQHVEFRNGFSLDDFGVGFTSFKYLKEMEVDSIKIDGSFIRKLHENKTDRLFVKAIADVAKGMGIKTTAEFVENEEIISFLREYGVDYAQGYFVGKPAPDIAGIRIG